MTNPTPHSGDWLDEFLEDLPNAWCQDCDHPRCLANKKSAKEEIQSRLSKHKLEVLEGRYDELEKVRWIIQKHNPNNTLADVFMALNHRSAELENERSKIEGTAE